MFPMSLQDYQAEVVLSVNVKYNTIITCTGGSRRGQPLYRPSEQGAVSLEHFVLKARGSTALLTEFVVNIKTTP